MNTKIRLFKHTFIVLSIMCCILLGSTSIIFAFSDMNSFGVVARVTDAPKVSQASQTSGKPSATTALQSAATASGSSTNQQASAQESQIQDAAGQTTDAKNNSSQGTIPPSSAGDTSGTAPSTTSSSEATNSDDGSMSGDSGEAPAVDTVTPVTPPEEDNTKNPDNSEPNKPATITISAVGDIMAHQSNLNNAYSPKTGTYDFTGFLEYVKPYLSKADLTIGNFETVTAGPKTGFTSYPSFNTPDSILSALSWSGFDILSSANNHCLDRGINGLTRTIEMIGKNKMINIGSSTNGKNKYVIRDINGIKLGILAYSGFYNGVDRKLSQSQKNTYLSPINELQMQKDIKALKAASTDAVIVVVHWGTEYQREPNIYQKQLAQKLLTWGADIILGSHPHVVQKSEIVKINGKDKFIIYSMGNFISGYRRVDKANRPNKVFTEDGVIVNLQLEKDPKKGTIIKDVSYIPTWVDKYYTNNRPVFKIIPIPEPDITGKFINNNNRAYIKQSYKNTMGIMAKMK